MARHFEVGIADGTFTYDRVAEAIAAGAAFELLAEATQLQARALGVLGVRSR